MAQLTIPAGTKIGFKAGKSATQAQSDKVSGGIANLNLCTTKELYINGERVGLTDAEVSKLAGSASSSDLTTLTGRVTAVEKKADANASGISSHGTRLDAVEKKADANASGISSHGTRLDAVEKKANANASAINETKTLAGNKLGRRVCEFGTFISGTVETSSPQGASSHPNVSANHIFAVYPSGGSKADAQFCIPINGKYYPVSSFAGNANLAKEWKDDKADSIYKETGVADPKYYVKQATAPGQDIYSGKLNVIGIDYKGSLSDINSLLGTVKSKAEANATAISGHGTRLTNVESKADTNASTISSHGLRLNAVEGKANTNASDILTLKTTKAAAADLNALTKRVEALEALLKLA